MTLVQHGGYSIREVKKKTVKGSLYGSFQASWQQTEPQIWLQGHLQEVLCCTFYACARFKCLFTIIEPYSWRKEIFLNPTGSECWLSDLSPTQLFRLSSSSCPKEYTDFPSKLNHMHRGLHPPLLVTHTFRPFLFTDWRTLRFGGCFLWIRFKKSTLTTCWEMVSWNRSNTRHRLLRVKFFWFSWVIR